MFLLFRDKKQLLPGCPTLYQKKLQEQGVQDVVTRNKIMFEQYGDLVDQAFSQFDENSINNQDSHRQIENDETPRAEYSTENDSDNTEIKKSSAILNLMKLQNSFYSNQREVFNVVHTWAKYYV